MVDVGEVTEANMDQPLRSWTSALAEKMSITQV